MKKTLYILSALLLGLVSCDLAEFEQIEPKEVEPTGLVAVTMKVQVPETLYATKALGDFSDNPSIKDIRVAVFGTSGYAQAYALAEPVDADGNALSTYATTNGDTYYFKVLLPVYEGEAHVHIIANGPESIKFVEEDEESIMTKMATEEGIGAFWARIVMPDGILTQLDQNGIMQTDTEGNFIPSDETARLFQDLVLVRNFAEVLLINDAENLTDVSWTLVNVPTKGSVAPMAAGSWVDDYKDYEYYSPSETNTETAKYGRMVNGNTVYNGYMFPDTEINETYPSKEAWPSAATKGFVFGDTGMNFLYERLLPGTGEKATCILLRGRFNGGDYTFYRIDLMDEEIGGYYPIYRNRRYQMKIWRVGNKGAATPEEAMLRDSGGNVSMTTEAQSLTDISDGISRLYVEYVEKNFTSGGKKTVWVQYKPDGTNVDNTKIQMSVKSRGLALKEDSEPTLTASSSDTGYYIYEFELNDQDENEDLVSVLHIKADNGLTEGNKSTLYRDITLRVLKKMDMELALKPKKVDGLGDVTVLEITLPEGLPGSMFPLEFRIEDVNHTLNPTQQDGSGNSVTMPVQTAKSYADGTTNSFYFIRTYNWSDYDPEQGGSNVVKTQFQTIWEKCATTLYVANDYFKTKHINLLNDGLYVNPTNATVAFNTTSVVIEVETEDETKGWTVAAGTGVTLDKTSGTGNDTFTMTFDENGTTSNVTRTATVTSDGVSHTVTITQNALVFSITPATQAVNGFVTTAEVKINATEGAAWTATVTGPTGTEPTLSSTSGEGPAIITVTIPANTGTSSRNFTVTATETITEREVSATITQRRGLNPSSTFNMDNFTYSINNRTGSATSADGYVTVNLSNISNVEDGWWTDTTPATNGYAEMGYRAGGQTRRGSIVVTPVVDGIKITGITVTYSTGFATYDFDYNPKVTVSTGSYTRSGDVGTWTGPSTDPVTFTNGCSNTQGNRAYPRITSIVVTCEAAE